MSALYQRARPVRFDEVVGQDHVIDLLGLAVRQGRIGHAYLFSGPRGVGKTTTARLLAMAANCENPEPDARPCGVCESCRLVQEGSHPDVTELDAASNNSVEDVRDLREKVGLAGLRGGTRVWILDEAHMLSRAAANALLKTLEEPPPGLLFILATTEPEKLPPTILSRCQHFRFRRLSEDEIVGKLQALAQGAGLEAEPDALRLVARVAEGGMRDAESMLERLLLEDRITAQDAEEALGLPPRQRLESMAQALAAGDVGRLLVEADALYRAGFSPRTLAEQLGRTLRDALIGSVQGTGFRVELDDAVLMQAIQALDDEMERFVRHNDLYALEVALIKTRNAATGLASAGSAAAADAAAADAAAAATLQAATLQPATGEPATGEAASGERTEGGPPKGEPSEGEPGKGEPAPTERAARSSGAAHRKRRAPATSAPASAPAAEGAAEGAAPDPAAKDAAPADAATPTAEGDAPTGAERPAAGRPAAGEPRKPLSWHAVKARAGAQLKAFLMPAQESVEGDVVRLRYDAVHRFHHGQLLHRADELAALIEEVAGSGYTVLIEGPEGGAPKKIA